VSHEQREVRARASESVSSTGDTRVACGESGLAERTNEVRARIC